MKQKATNYKANNISLANRCETALWTEGRVYSSIQLLLVEAIKKMEDSPLLCEVQSNQCGRKCYYSSVG